MKIFSMKVLGLALLSRKALKSNAEENNDQVCSSVDTCTSQNSTSKKQATYKPTCQYYLAPSSIPNAGFGIYTAQAIPANTFLMDTADAPSIVATDSETHYGIDTRWSHHDYFWSGEGYAEYEADSVQESVVTFGSLCNFHTYLYNVKPANDGYDDSMLKDGGRQSPGTGAYSYYNGYRFRSTRDIEAGEEVFAHYGEDWLDGRDGTYADLVPREDDFNVGAEVVKTIVEGLGEEVTDTIVSSVINIVEMFNERVASVLPKTTTGLDEVKADSSIVEIEEGANDDDEYSQFTKTTARAMAHKSVIPRSIEWILSTGQCLDNLIPAPSTLPHAGRGGFAQRFIAKGDMVVPAPLLQIMDFTSLYMYDLEPDEDGEMVKIEAEEGEEPDAVGMQLLTNYCFSHRDMSMLLCAQSNAILLNHCSTRKSYGGQCEEFNANEDKEKRGPNAVVRWTKSWDTDTKEWLKKSVPEIDRLTIQGKRGLSLDVVATRDILPGEEVFIDYGQDWEDAWEEHVASWTAPDDAFHIPIQELNESVYILRTPEELKTNPYPDNAQLGCLYWLSEDESHDDEDEEQFDDEEWIGSGEEYVISSSLYDADSTWHWPCEVRERKESSEKTKITYTVEIFQSKSESDTKWAHAGQSRILIDYPRESILFLTKPYMSDLHLYGVFREPIGIPDDILPQQWRDLKDS